MEATEAATALLDCHRFFLIGKPLGLLLATESRATFYEFLLHSKLYDGGRAFELRFCRPGGPAHDIIAMVERETAYPDERVSFRWQLRDVTSQRRIESALQNERQLLDSVIDAAQAMILILDQKGHVLRTNRFLHEITGYGGEELYSRHWAAKLVLPQDRLHAHWLTRETIEGKILEPIVLALPTRTGDRRSVAWSARGLPGGETGAVVLLGNDVTELEKAQAESLRVERLATIGQVAAGLAHEGRNALQRIQACLSMLALRVGGQMPEIADLVNRAQQAQDDLQHMFDDVLGYAVNPRLAPTLSTLDAVWREAWADLEVTRGQRDAELIEETADTDLHCEIDRFQIKRVFRNLFENALAATSDPVRITVGCRPGRLADRPQVRVSVRDNGPGFPPEVRERLFEPFHTTKLRGTGLGLAICRRIIEAHGGRMEAGKDSPGAEIVMTLPGRIS